MTEHEFFEMLNDLDDKMVVNAKPSVDTSYDPFSDMPMKIKPVRRSFWKPFAAVAACLAVMAVGLAVFLNIRSRQGELPFSSDTGSNIITPLDALANGYPKEAIYQYKGDFSELKITPGDYCKFWIYEGEDYQPSFAGADLIVVGTFVDDAYQTWDPNIKDDRKHTLNYGDYSCNKLRIEEVIKGGAEIGDEIIICDRYGIADGYLNCDYLTPMIKGDTWCYVLQRDYDKGDNCYSTSLFSRFPVPSLTQPKFPYIKNNCGYVSQEFSDDISQKHLEQNIEYAWRMLSGDPEILKTFRFEYNGVTYYIEGRGSEKDTAEVTVGLPRTEIMAGDTVEVVLIIKNTGSYAFKADITIKQPGSKLNKISDADTSDDADTLIQPGETRYIPMKFSTYVQSYKSDDTVIPDHAALGKYDGTVVLQIKSPYSLKTAFVTFNGIYESFNVNILDSRTDVEFTMDEFPGVSFNCGRNDLTARAGGKDIALFSDVPLKDLYLVDLNGDGRRELCSTVSVGFGSVDDRILAFDYANGKLYELSDRLNCDYHIEVGSDPNTGEWYVNAGRYDYTHGMLVSSVPLTLDLMTEIKSVTTDTNIRIETVKLAGTRTECNNCEFRMAEFPGVEFVCKEKAIFANDKPLKVESSTYHYSAYSESTYATLNFEELYLADLNGDNKREILAVCSDEGSKRTFVYIFDYANSASCNIGMNGSDTYSLYMDKDGIYLVTNGKRDDYRLKIAAPGIETIRDSKTDIRSFKLPEISESYEFILDDKSNNILIKRENGETEIAVSFNGNPLTKVYLSDINGDGRREIAAEGLSGSTSHIQVYDAVSSRLYEYNTENSSTLEFGDGGLAVAVRRADGSVLLSKTLTFDIMRLKVNSGKLKYLFIPEAKIVYDDSVRTERFTVPGYDGCEFVIGKNDIAVYENGVKTKDLFGSFDVKKVFLYDTECDEEEEIYAVVKRRGENKYVIAMAYKDRSGDIRTSFTESVNVNCDMNLLISDIRTLVYNDTALG